MNQYEYLIQNNGIHHEESTIESSREPDTPKMKMTYQRIDIVIFFKISSSENSIWSKCLSIKIKLIDDGVQLRFGIFFLVEWAFSVGISVVVFSAPKCDAAHRVLLAALDAERVYKF